MAETYRDGQSQIDFDADLMAEVNRLRADLNQAELDGAELALRSQERIAELEKQVQARPGKLKSLDTFCDKCEETNQQNIMLLGFLCGLLTYLLLRRGEREYVMTAIGFVSTLCFVYASFKWRWKQFKRRFEWFSNTDNRIYRAAQTRWNDFLEMFKVYGPY